MSDYFFSKIRQSSSMLRILRRSVYERIKFLELQVGDIHIATGVAVVDDALENCPALSKSFEQHHATYEKTLDSANRVLLSSLLWDDINNIPELRVEPVGPLPTESFAKQATRKVHERAIALLSEAIKRVPHPRLLFKRGKRNLALGYLTYAYEDVHLGVSRFKKLNSEHEGDPEVLFPQLFSDIQRLNAAVFVRQLDQSSFSLDGDYSAEQIEDWMVDLGFIRSPCCQCPRSELRERFLLDIRTQIFVQYFEQNRLDAQAKEKSADAMVAVRNSVPANAVGPERPSCTPPSTESGFAAAQESVSEAAKEPQTDEFIANLQCCYADCDRKSRRVRQKDCWTETICVTGCEAVCHKKCYRSFKQAHGNVCASCKKHPISGKVLYMTAETADELRAKRLKPSLLKLKRRPTQVIEEQLSKTT